jgi:hypothetical protein
VVREGPQTPLYAPLSVDAALMRGWTYRGFKRPVIFTLAPHDANTPERELRNGLFWISAQTEDGRAVIDPHRRAHWDRACVNGLYLSQEASALAQKRIIWERVGKEILAAGIHAREDPEEFRSQRPDLFGEDLGVG